jgi:nitrite reductase/ring-hydroxylating ferredoxin subunit
MLMRMALPAWARGKLPANPSDSSAGRSPSQLVIEARGDVVRIGSSGEIFGPAQRAVLRIERDRHLLGDVLLLHQGTKIVAVVSSCPHLARTLDDATICGRWLVCAGHGGQFSLRTGRPSSATARRLAVASALLILPTRSDDTAIDIDISELCA